jgi:hypothetical protein
VARYCGEAGTSGQYDNGHEIHGGLFWTHDSPDTAGLLETFSFCLPTNQFLCSYCTSPNNSADLQWGKQTIGLPGKSVESLYLVQVFLSQVQSFTRLSSSSQVIVSIFQSGCQHSRLSVSLPYQYLSLSESTVEQPLRQSRCQFHVGRGPLLQRSRL